MAVQEYSENDIRLYTPKELQQILHMSKNTIYKLIHTKGFPVIYIGHKVLTPHDELQRWISNNLGNRISI